jgi:acyl carrier protein
MRRQKNEARSAIMVVEALRDKVRDFILENYLFTTDTSAIGYDDSLLDRGIVDSTGMLEIIFFIEEQLGVKVKDEEMVPDNLDSVNKIAQFVHGKRQAS